MRRFTRNASQRVGTYDEKNIEKTNLERVENIVNNRKHRQAIIEMNSLFFFKVIILNIMSTHRESSLTI